MMAQAGYNPLEMARFFEKLQAQGGRGGPAFLSDHPDPGNRVNIVQEEIAYMPRRNYTETGTGELGSIKSRLGSLPATRRALDYAVSLVRATLVRPARCGSITEMDSLSLIRITGRFSVAMAAV